jgi:hypothetical protein
VVKTVFTVDSYMRETLATLRLFERDLMSSFVEKERAVVETSLDARVEMLDNKMDQLLELFEVLLLFHVRF